MSLKKINKSANKKHTRRYIQTIIIYIKSIPIAATNSNKKNSLPLVITQIFAKTYENKKIADFKTYGFELLHRTPF